MESLFLELLKTWGPPGLLCLVLYWALTKGETREKAKDERIQLLENKLTESYDERVTIADQMAAAQVKLAAALTDLTNEIRNTRGTRR
jgi:hypothetical protein